MKYDIVIVGGGLVGASLACALRHLPLKIAMIEARSYQQKIDHALDVRTVAISEGSKRIFEHLGLWLDLAAHSLPIKQVHVSDKGHFGFVRLTAQELEVDSLGSVIEVPTLQQLLYATVAASPNIDLYETAQVVRIKQRIPSSELVLQYQNNSCILQADLIVAADGGASTVRKLLGINAYEKSYRQHAIVGTIQVNQAHQHTAYERFTADGPIALLPMHQQRCSLVWTVPSTRYEAVLALPDQLFLQTIQQHFGYRAGCFTAVGQRAAFPLTLIKTREYVQPGVVIMGNAAHSVHPIAGQGFNLGLRDAETLASVVQQAITEQRAINSTEVLMQYQRQRTWDQRAITSLTDGLARLFIYQQPWITVPRDIAMCLVDNTPPLKRLFGKVTMGLLSKSSLFLPHISAHSPIASSIATTLMEAETET
ncbi:MAG: 2-octaprenyl-6-methoxyphenyl hydroxylase [Gammaproteobacteria bacterium]